MTAQAPRRRADAERNIAAILVAAGELFAGGENPAMGEIATAAGVRRATLYAHFPSREELLDAVVERAVAEADEALTALGLDRDAADTALERLVRTSWPVLDRHRRLHTAALAGLGPERLRRHHDRAFRHVEHLISRGRDDGRFRSDLPKDWLVTTFYAVLHAAADEVNAGRLSPAEVPGLLTTTMRSLLAGD